MSRGCGRQADRADGALRERPDLGKPRLQGRLRKGQGAAGARSAGAPGHRLVGADVGTWLRRHASLRSAGQLRPLRSAVGPAQRTYGVHHLVLRQTRIGSSGLVPAAASGTSASEVSCSVRSTRRPAGTGLRAQRGHASGRCLRRPADPRRLRPEPSAGCRSDPRAGPARSATAGELG